MPHRLWGAGALGVLCSPYLFFPMTATGASAVPHNTNISDILKRDYDVTRYASLGESFTTGPGAGDTFDNPFPACRRYQQAFGPQLNDDRALFGDDRKFDFIACSGSKIKQIYSGTQGRDRSKPTDSQAKQLAGTDPDLVTLSIGGNDVGLVDVLDHCVYRFYDPFCNGCGIVNKDCTDNCKKYIKQAQDYIDGIEKRDDMTVSQGLDKAIQAIFDTAPNAHLYVLLYPGFFNSDTEACDNIQFNVGCEGNVNSDPISKILPLTRERRTALNNLAHNLNNKLKAAVDSTRPPLGGRISWVDVNAAFDGHRFCEEGVHEPSYRNDDIWFYPLEFYKGPTLDYISTFNNMTNCTALLDGPTDVHGTSSGGGTLDGDWGDYLACQMAISAHGNATRPLDFLNKNGNIGNDSAHIDSSGSLPEFLARIFHPTIKGHQAYKDAILSHYRGDPIVATAKPTPTPTPSFACKNPSAEDGGDGKCTCSQGTMTITTTQVGGTACPTAAH